MVYTWIKRDKNKSKTQKVKGQKAMGKELADAKLEIKVLKELLKKNSPTLAERLEVAEIFINQGYCVCKVLKYTSVTNSTWYSQKHKVKEDKRKNNPGRPIPGYTINPDGTIILDGIIVLALENYRNKKEFANGGGY